MIERLEREPAAPQRQLGVARRDERLEAVVDGRAVPELALRYSNGFVTVEITHDAFDAYVEANGGSALPVFAEEPTPGRRNDGAPGRVRVIYDRAARLREVTSRSSDGHYVRLTWAVPP